MCTLAWDLSGEDLWICFNRDEQRSRPEAEAPVVDRSGKYPVIYPLDPQGGGTWLAVSQAGFAVALMNNYSGRPVADGNLKSRGGIVRELIRSSSIDSAAGKFSGMSLAGDYAPFYLFVISRDGGRQWCWDGEAITMADECPKFWTTSSHEPGFVCRWRRDQWKKLTSNVTVSAELAGSILRMKGSPPAYGMTMDRDDARTVSQSIIKINEDSLVFSYLKRDSNGTGFEASINCQL